MKVINASSTQLNNIMEIINQAQKYLASLQIDQWQNGYPDELKIRNDIKNQESFLVLEQNQIIATVMFTTVNEPTYATIEGNWLTKEATYGVIHRMAVNNDFRNTGVAKFIFNHFEQLLISQKIKSMRIDTHQDNKGMQSLLIKLDYQYCGTINLEDGNMRLAYEKLLF